MCPFAVAKRVSKIIGAVLWKRGVLNGLYGRMEKGLSFEGFVHSLFIRRYCVTPYLSLRGQRTDER